MSQNGKIATAVVITILISVAVSYHLINMEKEKNAPKINVPSKKVVDTNFEPLKQSNEDSDYYM